MLSSTGSRAFANPRATRNAPYAADERAAILSLAALACAKREIMAWPGYKPTPVHPLPKLAARAGIEAILYKDEAERFGLGSFKALGGAYAVFKLLRKSIQEQKNVTASSLDLTSGRYADVTSRITDVRNRRQSRSLRRMGSAHLWLPVRDLYPRNRQRGSLPGDRRLWRGDQALRRDL